MKVLDQGSGQYLVQTEGDENDVIAWALTNHSPTILVEVIRGWLRGERGYKKQKQREELDNLTDAEKAQIPLAIRAKLGL